MKKNVASQKWTVFAFDVTTGLPKTGDAANITGNLRLDGTQNAIDDTNPTELERGYYQFDITQAESNADYIVMCAVSSTANIQVVGCPGALYTDPVYYQLNNSITELSAGAPSATPTIFQAIMLLYMAIRNVRTSTDSLITIKNDAGTAICKASLSDDGTTFTKGELVTP